MPVVPDNTSNSITQSCHSESPAKASTVQYQPGRGGARQEASGRAGGGAAHAVTDGLGAGALAAMAQLAYSQIHDNIEGWDREERSESTYQMSVPNMLIGEI